MLRFITLGLFAPLIPQSENITPVELARPQVRELPASSPPVRYFRYDEATGRLSHEPVTAATGNDCAPRCYDNMDDVGGYIVPSELWMEELIDAGMMGGTAGTICSTANATVTGVDLIYITTAEDMGIGGPGAEFTLRFYRPWDPFGAPTSPIYEVNLSGMPGTRVPGAPQPVFLCLDLSPGFDAPTPSNIGIGYTSPEASLVGDGLAPTGLALAATGTFAVPESSTGNYDFVNSWLPDVNGISGGTVTTGSGDHSFAVALRRTDPGVSHPGSQVNLVCLGETIRYTCAPPAIGKTWTATINRAGTTHTSSHVFAYTGDIGGSVCIPWGGGGFDHCLRLSEEKFGGTGLGPLFSIGTTDFFSWLVPNDPNLCGKIWCTQGLLTGSGTAPIFFTNGIEITFGN